MQDHVVFQLNTRAEPIEFRATAVEHDPIKGEVVVKNGEETIAVFLAHAVAGWWFTHTQDT